MTELTPLIHLKRGGVSVVVDCASGVPAISHWGAELAVTDIEPASWRATQDPALAQAGLDVRGVTSLVPETASGFLGHPGLSGHRPDGSGFQPRFALVSHDVSSDEGGHLLVTRSADEVAGLELTCELLVDSAGVLKARATVANVGADGYQLDHLGLSTALPGRAGEVLSFSGRWCGEYRPQRQALAFGSTVVENRSGRTSHDRIPVVFAGTAGFTDETGEVWGLHLGWSGNSKVTAEVNTDNSRHIQLGELFLSGEMLLEAGETYESPWVFGAHSLAGTDGASQRFHRHLRSRPNHPGPDRPRPVGMNTWEAVYFDHNLDTLKALADKAAEVGVERYILDDGWFHGRRDDTAGLGDWWVDQTVWPDGLTPLVDHVVALGMEFGIWVEPEMVNPNSDLYRAHPDWVLTAEGYDPVLARNQLVLDLAKPEVFTYLLDHLDRLLSDHPDVAYVKWDMNRNLVHPAHDGRAGVHGNTVALYRLLDEVRSRHPDVEIESCSSGGARADFAILERTDRVWTSDCNDALERQTIQRGFSHLFPPELMGAHVGPTHSHTTGRQHSLSFRGATAIFGHLGVEWNLLHAAEHELSGLAELIALHKAHRGLLHTGVARRFDHPDESMMVHGVVAEDQSEAILATVALTSPETTQVAPLRISGLDPDRQYRVTRLNLPHQGHFGPAKAQPAWLDEAGGPVSITGRALAQVGLQLPVMNPETAILLHLEGR